MRPSFRLAALAFASLAVGLAGVVPVSAHPMGNFSINHYAALAIERHTVRLLYIIDMAEIPTFQELGDLNAARTSALSPAQRATYLFTKARSLAAGLSLSLDGHPLLLSLRADDLLFPPGAGGLPTERLYLVLQAALPRTAGTLSYQDNNYPNRAGWKEIVVTATGGASLRASSVPATSRSQALSIYPSTVINSPPQDVAATFTVATGPGRPAADLSPALRIRQAEAPLLGGGGAWSPLAQRLAVKGPAAAPAGTQPVSWAQGRTDALTDLMARRSESPAFLGLALVLAAALGALHAFSPGHGKTVVAAYIVGSRATARHAVILGLTVTITHTLGVFVLGLVTLWLSHYIVPDQLYPWLGAASGLCITAIGLSLGIRRLATLRGSPGDQAHQHHAPDHDHGHGADHVHLPDASIITTVSGREPGRQYSADEEGRYAAVGS